MKKDGFTLVELLIVVAILAILVIIIMPNITNIRDDVLEKDYKTKVSNIETAAKDWAYDNLNLLPTTLDSSNKYTICTYITVNELIVKGYIVGDKNNKTILENPITNESMNSLKVCVRYNVEQGYSKRILVSNIEE